MSQASVQITTTPPLPGLTLVNALNAAFAAMGSGFAGSSDPAGLDGVGPYFTWIYTGVSPAIIRRRNAGNTAWVDVGKAFVDTSKASGITFENTASGLAATDVQAAIDEIAGMLAALAANEVPYDGTASGLTATDVQGAIDEVSSTLTALVGTFAMGPGPQSLIAGDMTAGFFGEVEASELFTGEELAFRLGVTQGVIQNSNTKWLKFARNNKILYGPMLTIMHSVSWDHIYSRGLVYGTDDVGLFPRGTPVNQRTLIGKGGHLFVVRLFTGANADPLDDTDPRFYTADMYELNLGGGSEWNDLWYRVCVDVPVDGVSDGQDATRHGGPQVGGNWASYTGSDLNVGAGNGRYTWCQEASLSSASLRVFRGATDVAYFSRSTASDVSTNRGWRPCLELIPNY